MAQAPPPAAQNPSPMTDTVRAHRRVDKTEIKGKRWNLSAGTLLLPDTARPGARLPLVVHFHGASWLAEHSAARWNRRAAILSVHLGAGSRVYAQAFAEPARFAALLDEAARALNAGRPPQFEPVVLTSFSAGYSAIREILKDPRNVERVSAVVLADSLHTSYVPEGKPGPLETAPLEPFVEFARQAAAGRKQLVMTHSEIFPGAFASTTETAEHVLSALGMRRRAVLGWGPMGMQQISEARAGKLRVLGFAGNTAPDHIDHFHALETWLKMLK